MDTRRAPSIPPFVEEMDLEKRTAIVIPGLFGNRGLMKPLEWRLRQARFNVLVPDFGTFVWGDIDVIARKLIDFLLTLDDFLVSRRGYGVAAGSDEISFFPVSMGGLVLLSAERQADERKLFLFRKTRPHPTVMIGIPALGAPLARPFKFLGKHFEQMTPGSEFLKQHVRILMKRGRVVYVYSRTDRIVPRTHAYPKCRKEFAMEAPVTRHYELVTRLSRKFLEEAHARALQS